MIDLLRIYEFRDLPLERFLGGQYEGKTIGTVLFEDGSIGFGVKINGKNILNYSDEDLYQYYQSIVGFLNKSILNFSTKVTSATYQFIYIPEFNYDDFIKRILNTNFFETSRENEEAYFNTVNEKIDEIKATLNEFQLFLNTKEYVNSLDEKEIKKLKQDIVRLKNDYEVLLKNFITSSMSIKYLRKFYEALNLRTVELLKSSILGIVRRHRYYLYCRYFPNYKDLNLNFSSVKENVEDIIFSEEESINQYVMNMFTNIVNHAMFLSNSLPFGGIILTIDELVNTMFRYMGMPSLSFNNATPLARLFPYEMDINKDALIIKDVPNSPVPVYDRYGKIVSKQDTELSDIVINMFSVSSLPDPGTANIATSVDYLAGIQGDYSINWNFFRELRRDSRKRINANYMVFKFVTEIPILSKRLFSEESIEIKKRMFKFATYNLEMGELGDFFMLSNHLVLRRAVPSSERVELEKLYSARLGIENDGNKKAKIEQNPDFKKDLNKLYNDPRVAIVNTDFFRKLGGGVTAIREKDSVPAIMFSSAFPTSFRGWKYLERYMPLYAPSLGALLPFHEEPEGMSKCGLLLETPTGLYNHNHFALAGAKNFVISGGTGSGKTFFEVNRLINMFRNGARLIFIDRGAALYRAVQFLNGQNIKLRMFSKSELIKDKLNPFVIAEKSVHENEEDFSEYIQAIREFLVTLLCSICSLEDNNIAIRCFTQLIDDELLNNPDKHKVRTDYGTSSQITFTDIYSYLYNKRSDQSFSELLSNDNVLSAIKNFTKDGLYGSLFDGIVTKPLIVSPAVCIDFEGLESEKVAQVALAIVNSYIWNIVLGTGGFIPELGKSYHQTNVDFDEVWATLKSKIGQVTIETGARTFRKHGAGLGLLTQSAADIGNSPIRDAIISNVQHVFAMAAKEGDVQNFKSVFGFTDTELKIVQNLKYKYGVYNELYYKCLDNVNRHLSTKLRLRPLPLTYAIVSSDPNDRALMDRLKEKFVLEVKDGDNIAYMKSVLLFAKVFPHGVEAYPRYQEIMSRIGNDLFKFLDNVLEEHKIKLNNFVLEDELYNIRLDNKL
jgi:hypothetical protein